MTKIKNHETRKRSVLKAITSKILEILTSAVICQILFNQPIITIGLPTLLEVCQLLVYFLHERMWSRITWGHLEPECEECHFKEFHEEHIKRGEPHE